MKKPILLIGGGDHCKSVIEIIEKDSEFIVNGIIDLKEKIGQRALGYPIIASDEEIPQLAKKYLHFFITIGHVKTSNKRKSTFELLKSLGLELPIIVSQNAIVSKHSTIGEGTLIFTFSTIDVETEIGRNCIINHASIIGHGAIIEDSCHISANCVLGKCKIGSGTFIGGNSWINNNVEIAPGTVIGSASNVIHNIVEPGIYVGNPARKIKV